MKAHKGGISLGTLLALLVLIVGGIYLFMQRMNKSEVESYDASEVGTRRSVAKQEVYKSRVAEESEQEQEECKEEEHKRNKRKLAEKLREQKKRAAQSEAYVAAIDSFEDVKTFLFWPDLRKEKKPDFSAVGTTSWCILDDFSKDKTVYVLKGQGNGAISVTKFQEEEKEEMVTQEAFEKLLAKNKSAILCNGTIYLRGITKNHSLYALPKNGKGFRPFMAELGDLGAALIDVGADFDERLARLTLCSKDGAQMISLGVIPYGGVLDSDKLDDTLEQMLAKEKKAGMSVKRIKPKLIKFKQTVFLYDGHIIKKTMDGKTYVPRVFQHLGTSRTDRWGYSGKNYDTVEKFRIKWEQLYAEARRQELRLQEVEQENERRIAEARQKNEELRIRAEKDAKVKSHEVADEYDDWLIRVERGKKI